MIKPSCIILAAGYSSRMAPNFKPVLEVNQQPLIIKLIEELRAAEITEIIIIVGHKKELIYKTLKENNILDVKIIENNNYDDGMFSSVQVGVSALRKTSDFLILPIDTPLLQADAIKKIISRSPQPFEIIYPSYRHRKGHPPYISSHCIPTILSYEGNNGLKGALSIFNEQATYLEMDNDATIIDMDTLEDYQFILKKEL